MLARTRLLTFGLAVFTVACSDNGTGPDDGTAAGVDLNALFAAPTQSELDAVAAQWAARSPGAEAVEIEVDTVIPVDTVDVRVRVVSHEVDGLRHVGAILSTDGATGPSPMMVYTHGSDQGVRVEDVLFFYSAVGAEAAEFVWVIPSFRSEPLEFAGQTFTSQGSASPWDGDVDDALALVDVTLSIEPAADVARIGVLGFSRGSGVGLLMGVRDDRIDRVVEFFGPTDFFDDWMRGIVRDALLGQPADLPGLEFLDQTYLQPLARGEKTIAEVRLELVRRSPALYAADLPAVQLHHGTADATVPVSQAESLIAAMSAIGRGEPEFQAYLYEGGAHSPLTLSGSVTRTSDFLLALLGTPLVLQ